MGGGDEGYRAFVEQSTEGVFCFEVDPPVPTDWPAERQVQAYYERSSLVECNDAMARMYGLTGRDALLGARLADFLPPDQPESVAYLTSFIGGGYRIADAETAERDRRGRPRYYLNNLIGILDHGALTRVWGAQRDVTNLKLLEAQLRVAQRLEALGMLAAGVAHDFNNLLAAMMGHCELLLLDAPPGAPHVSDVEAIRQLVERAADMTRQLLAVGRSQELKPVPLSLNTAVERIAPILRRLVGSRISLEVRPDPDLAPVRADPNEIERVLLNLAVNARDAMPRGGVLTIATADMVHEATADPRLVAVPPGRYARLSVQDTGVGMDDAVLQRIFEPFFTTKERGTGTGLGLAVVHGVVTQSGGYLLAESAPSQGSRFDILLPATADAVANGSGP